MKFVKYLFLISTILFVSSSVNAQEQNQKLYRIFPTDFKLIKNIESRGVNVYNSSTGNYIDIVATDEQIERIENEIGRVEFLAGDFMELVDSRLKSGSYAEYHNHQQTVDLMNLFATSFPNITHLDTIGFSNLGREICCLKISDNPEIDEDEIPILMAGCHHGNEVLSVEATLYQIDFLLNNYGSDMEVTQWIDNMEIWYVPLVNPDGREAVRRYNNNDVDLNRNYSFQHTAGGSHGPSGFSEPETSAIRDLAAKYPPVLSLTYHTSGRLLLLPWTHTDESAPDSLALTYQGNIIAESITFPAGAGTDHYELRQGGDWYFTEGEYCDYMYATHNTFAYTVEMWTSQTPPSDVIPQVVERNLEGMKTLFRQAEMAGITGLIKDKTTGLPIVAEISFPFIDNQNKTPELLTEPEYGRYYKYLVPGSYSIVITAPGYRTIKKEIVISAENLTKLDIEMEAAPELELSAFLLDDATGNRISGNGDGKINIGETIGILLSLYNDQDISAEGAYIKASTTNPYIDFITDSLYFGSIAHYSTIQSTDTLLFKLKSNCPDGEEFVFHLDIGDEINIAWSGEIALDAFTPKIEIDDMVIRDDEGNNNGIIDKGESVMLGFQLQNNGHQNITAVSLTTSTADQYFSVQAEPVEVISLATGTSEFVEFWVSLSSLAPDIYSGYINLNISSSETYNERLSIPISNINGFMDDFENGTNGWTHASYMTTQNTHDDWQLGTPQGKAGDPSAAFSGNNCWGTDLGYELYEGETWNGEYQNNVFNYLQSPPIDCSNMVDVGLRFQRWLNTRANDIATIYVNENRVWKSSARGYSDQDWTEQMIDISEFADGNPEIRIKFELQTSSSNTLGGWNIDDFLVAHKLASGNVSSKFLNNQNSDVLECYPNPFTHNTNIIYKLEKSGYIELAIFNTLGEKISTLISESQMEGNHSVQWDGKSQSGILVDQGIYFIKLRSESINVHLSVIIIR